VKESTPLILLQLIEYLNAMPTEGAAIELQLFYGAEPYDKCYVAE
jgi:hypothetical protein